MGGLLPLMLLLGGCDPLLSIQGSFWPPWIMSMLAGIALCAGLMKLLDRYDLVDHMGPHLVVYPCLWAWLTFSVWLLAFA